MKKKPHTTDAELPFSPVLAAVRLAGGVSRVARILDVQRPTLYNWIHRGRLVNDQTLAYATKLNELSGISINQLIVGMDAPPLAKKP